MNLVWHCSCISKVKPPCGLDNCCSRLTRIFNCVVEGGVICKTWVKRGCCCCSNESFKRTATVCVSVRVIVAGVVLVLELNKPVSRNDNVGCKSCEDSS